MVPERGEENSEALETGLKTVNAAVVLSELGHHALMAAEGDWERSFPRYSTKARKEDAFDATRIQVLVVGELHAV